MQNLTNTKNRDSNNSLNRGIEKTPATDQVEGAFKVSTTSDPLHPHRIADHVVRIDEKELSTISRQIGNGKLSMDQFVSRINLSPGKEVTLALPEERVVTLRRAGRGDVIWVDPAVSVYVIHSLVSGEMCGAKMRTLLRSADESDPQTTITGVQVEGFAIQGVIPKTSAYEDRGAWKKEAIFQASVAIHELAHLKEGASEYVAYKRDHEYRARLGTERMASPQELLDQIAGPLYAPIQIMRAVVDAATIENAKMVTAELDSTTVARWYGCAQGGRCPVMLEASKGNGEWHLEVSRVWLPTWDTKNLFTRAQFERIGSLSISDAKLRTLAAAHDKSPKDKADPADEPGREVRRGVESISERVMAELLNRPAESSQVFRNEVQAVFHKLGLSWRRSTITNFILDHF